MHTLLTDSSLPAADRPDMDIVGKIPALQTYCRNKYLLQDLVVGENSDFAVELSQRAMDEGITLLRLPAWLRRMRRVLPECRTRAWGLKWGMVVEYATRGSRNQRR